MYEIDQEMVKEIRRRVNISMNKSQNILLDLIVDFSVENFLFHIQLWGSEILYYYTI